jgi:hypothetical protein
LIAVMMIVLFLQALAANRARSGSSARYA